MTFLKYTTHQYNSPTLSFFMCKFILTINRSNSPKNSIILYEYHVLYDHVYEILCKGSQTFNHTVRVTCCHDRFNNVRQANSSKLSIILYVFHDYKLSINGSHVLYDHIYKILCKFSQIFYHTVRATCCHYYTYKTPYKFYQIFNYAVTYCHNHTLTKHYTNSPKLSFII